MSAKQFQCGHRGLGQWCHRCAQASACDSAARGGEHNGTGMPYTKTREGDVRPTKQQYADEAQRLRMVGAVRLPPFLVAL